MAVQFFDEGVVRERDRLLGVVTVPTLEVLLFTSPTALSNATVFSSFVEVTSGALPGYARVSLTPGSWTLTLATPVATGVYPTITWNFTANSGSNVIYGYAVVDTASPTVALWGELFAGGITVPSVGMDLNLNLTYQHEPCP